MEKIFDNSRGTVIITVEEYNKLRDFKHEIECGNVNLKTLYPNIGVVNTYITDYEAVNQLSKYASELEMEIIELRDKLNKKGFFKRLFG